MNEDHTATDRMGVGMVVDWGAEVPRIHPTYREKVIERTMDAAMDQYRIDCHLGDAEFCYHAAADAALNAAVCADRRIRVFEDEDLKEMMKEQTDPDGTPSANNIRMLPPTTTKGD